MKSMIRICAAVAVSALWSIAAVAAEGDAKILFDQGHGQRFLIEQKGDLQLSGLAEIMSGQGIKVLSTTKPLSDDVLKEVTALVISGPFATFASDEIESVARFIDRGGRLAVMLHIGPPLAGLLDRLDIDHSNAVLHERHNQISDDTGFRVANMSAFPLFSGLAEFSVYGCWALDPGKAGVAVAMTTPDAWVDLDGNKALSKGDVVGAFNVVVAGTLGAGSFVVFGDDALFQNRYLDDNNRKLAGNLASWLVGR